jgi:hypothetical protein
MAAVVGDPASATRVSLSTTYAPVAEPVALTKVGKGSLVLNAIDYGAVGNATADDTAAIQAAINALGPGGGTVLLPGGKNYKLTGAGVSLVGGARLIGASTAGSQITYTGTGHAVTIPGVGNCAIDGLTITSSTGGGIAVTDNSHNNVISNNRFFCSNGTRSAIDLTGNINELTIEKNLIMNIASSGGCVAAFGANNVRFLNNSISAGAGNGLYVAPLCDNWLIAGNNFEGNATGNIGIIVAGTSDVSIIGNYLEQWLGACIDGRTSAKCLTIQGNSLQATSAAAAAVLLTGSDGVTATANYSGTLGNASMTTAMFSIGTCKGFRQWANRSGGASTTIVSGGTPVLTPLAGAGTTPPTPTATGTDVAGTVTWGTGTAPAIGAQMQVAWGGGYANAPIVTLIAANAATALLGPYVHGAPSTGGFNIGLATAPAASQAATVYSVAFTVTGS